MTTPDPIDPDLIRRFIDNWAALHAGTLQSDQQALLDREYPHWQCTAATLIAEGLLAYVTVEMVEPDLTHDREAHGYHTPTPQEYAARLGAHMMDFVDYRDDLVRVRRFGSH